MEEDSTIIVAVVVIVSLPLITLEVFRYPEQFEITHQVAISKVSCLLHCVDPFGYMPKRDNNWRLIIELRYNDNNIMCDSFENNELFVSIDV